MTSCVDFACSQSVTSVSVYVSSADVQRPLLVCRIMNASHDKPMAEIGLHLNWIQQIMKFLTNYDIDGNK